MFGHRRVLHAGTKRDLHLQLGRGLHVYLVEADAVLADDFQTGQRFLDDGASNGVVAAEKTVEVAGEFEHPRFWQRPAFADDLIAGSTQHLVVFAGSVLKRSCGEQDALVHIVCERKPPSTRMSAPVTKLLARSLARNTAAPAN